MSKMVLAFVLLLGGLFPLSAAAEDSLVRFEGGIGVIPVSRAATPQNPDGSFQNVVRNDVFNAAPGGQPWVIARLRADVKRDGRISVDGRGLLLAGGTNVGSRGGTSRVHARLFCGGVAHNSGGTDLALNGDFQIDDVLDPVPPDPCAGPVLLIVSGNGPNTGNWFAAGILEVGD